MVLCFFVKKKQSLIKVKGNLLFPGFLLSLCISVEIIFVDEVISLSSMVHFELHAMEIARVCE